MSNVSAHEAQYAAGAVLSADRKPQPPSLIESWARHAVLPVERQRLPFYY